MKDRWVHPVKALTPSFYIFYQLSVNVLTDFVLSFAAHLRSAY